MRPNTWRRLLIRMLTVMACRLFRRHLHTRACPATSRPTLGTTDSLRRRRASRRTYWSRRLRWRRAPMMATTRRCFCVAVLARRVKTVIWTTPRTTRRLCASTLCLRRRPRIIHGFWSRRHPRSVRRWSAGWPRASSRCVARRSTRARTWTRHPTRWNRPSFPLVPSLLQTQSRPTRCRLVSSGRNRSPTTRCWNR